MRLPIGITLLVALLPLAMRAEERQTEAAIRQFTSDEMFRHSSVSVGIWSQSTGKLIAGVNTEQALVAASLTKIPTTAAALELLGNDFCYTTRLMHSGHIDNNGTIEGDLYIVGSGDPSLGSAYAELPPDSFIRSWIEVLQQKGVRQITGSVVAVDPTIETVSPKWLWEDIANYYGSGVSKLNINDNSYSITIHTTGTTTTTPPISDINYIHNYTTRPSGNDSLGLTPRLATNDILINGVIDRSKTSRTIRGALPNPPLHLAQQVDQLIRESGIAIGGLPRRVDSCRTTTTLLATHRSQSLGELCQATNFRSINLYAEAILQTFAHHYAPVEAGNAANLLLRYWTERGINTSGARLYDGSGLAPTNRLPARFVAELLIHARRSPHLAVSLTLPLVGSQGTVRQLWANKENRGYFRLKSGSMEQVVCYAGYIDRPNRREVIVIMINQYTGKRTEVNKKIETLLRSIQ